VLCLRPERIALIAARHLLKSLQEHTQSDIRLLMTEIEGGIPREAAERFIGRPISMVIPYAKETANAVNKGAPFVSMYPEASVTCCSANWLKNWCRR